MHKKRYSVASESFKGPHRKHNTSNEKRMSQGTPGEDGLVSVGFSPSPGPSEAVRGGPSASFGNKVTPSPSPSPVLSPNRQNTPKLAAAPVPSPVPNASACYPEPSPMAAAGDDSAANTIGPEATLVDEAALHTLPSGEVQRRAPVNPLHSPILARFGIGKNRKRRRKVKDPKLLNNPLRGRLVVCISTTALLMWLFFWEMIYNYTSFNGRCVSMVQYPNYKTENLADRAPMVIRYGYGACEYNLGSLSTPRVGVGTSASDKGWPTELVKNGSAGSSAASWDSPNSRILTVFGGLETNYMRNYGESWRVFTSMYLHGGFLHIGINLLCQIQSLWMLEPDWGFWRTALLFFIGGVTGNLLSAVADPCNITVGSSGAMYSLMGALIPYCVEYWKTIPRPCCILIFFIIVLLIGILTGMSGFTDNYAHMGGCVGGILFGFASITTVAACDKCTLGERMATTKPFSYCVPKKTQERLLELAKARKEEAIKRRRQEAMKKKKAGGARGKAMRAVKMQVAEQGRPPCKMAAREWIVRITCLAALIAMWVGLFLALLKEDIYKGYSPPGQLKFEGWLYCKCGIISYEARQTTWNKGMFWCFGNDQDANFYLTP